MRKPEEQAHEKMVQHLQSAQLDRVSRVCISTTQRLYSMLSSLFFWIETLAPQGEITRRDRQRVVAHSTKRVGRPENISLVRANNVDLSNFALRS